MEKQTLPDWLNAHLPETKTPHHLRYEANKFIVSYEGQDLQSFNSMIEAYDAYHPDTDFFFDETLHNHGGELLEGMYFCDPENNRSGRRLLIGVTDDDRRSILIHAFENSLNVHQRYESHPEDWVLSYQLLDAHPAFWVKSNCNDDGPTWDWSTENISTIWHHVSRHDEKVIVMMETGAHTDDMKSRFHDLRLDVYADSMEQAFVLLAAKVNKFFNPDGSEIPDVEYEKSDLELELESRLGNLEQE